MYKGEMLPRPALIEQEPWGLSEDMLALDVEC